MIFISDKTKYQCISQCISGKKMDVYICESEEESELYYIWAVKDSILSRNMTKVFMEDGVYKGIDCFFVGALYCIVFPYEKDRNLFKFAIPDKDESKWAREICLKLIFLCMSSRLPWEILYILITEKKISIRNNGEVYFNYNISIIDMENKTQKDCTSALGMYMENMLKERKCSNWSGYRLICMKNKRKNYISLSELYQDINNSIEIDVSDNIGKKLLIILNENKPIIIRTFKVLCITVAFIAVIVFISNIVFDESPFYRLFFNTFKKIGTETLLQ